VTEARQWIEFGNPDLSVREQCRILGIQRSSIYYDPQPETEENLQFMRLMDEEHLRHPARGSRQMVDFLEDQGFKVNRKSHGIEVSMDSKGRAIDNVMIERLWRTVKYEEVYLKEYVTGTDLQKGLGSYFDFYANERKHSSLDRQTPAEVYRSGRSKRIALSI
jgi:transposase InsO family protein